MPISLMHTEILEAHASCWERLQGLCREHQKAGVGKGIFLRAENGMVEAASLFTNTGIRLTPSQTMVAFTPYIESHIIQL